MRRRALLTSVAAAVSAPVTGCAGFGYRSSNASAEVPTARLEMNTITVEELPPKVLYTIETEDSPDERAKLLERILDDGDTVRATRAPLPESEHIAYGGAVYQLSHEVVEQTPATRYSVKVDIVEGSVNESKAIRFSKLPEADREAFAEHGLADGEPVGIGTTFLYTDAERKQSVLVPDSEYEYITWKDGTQAEWVVEESYDATLKTYRYTAEKVASAAEYGKRMRERFAFELTNLPKSQRKIVETAIDSESYVVGPDESPSDALLSLAERFRPQEQARGLDEKGEDDVSGSYLVRYDGSVYWTTFVVRKEALTTKTTA